MLRVIICCILYRSVYRNKLGNDCIFIFRMMSGGDYIQLLVFWGGNIIQSESLISYDRPPMWCDLIPRTMTFSEVQTRICEMRGVDINEFGLTIKTPMIVRDGSIVHRTFVMPIENDYNWNHLLNPLLGKSDLELFVEFSRDVNENDVVGPSSRNVEYSLINDQCEDDDVNEGPSNVDEFAEVEVPASVPCDRLK